MNKTRTFLAVGFLLTIAAGCGVKMNSSVEKNNYRNYKTYAWVEQPRPKPVYRAAATRLLPLDIQSEIDQELKSRGFMIDTLHPDFLIDYKAFLEKENYSKQNNFKSSLSGYTGVGNIGPSNIPQGLNLLSVKIEFLDPADHKAFWNGGKNRLVGDVLSLTGILEKDVRLIMRKSPFNFKADKQ